MDKSQCKKDTDRMISSPKDVKTGEWKDDIREWPQVEYGDIYNHLILSRACDGEKMKNYKSLDSYNYFKSGSVGKILHFIIHNTVILKSEVRPSQKINSEFHNAWVFCDMIGTILNGGCSCMAGNSKTCSHVGALLWKIVHAVRLGFTGKSCTDEQMQWNKGATRNLEPGVLEEMDFKKPKYGSEVNNNTEKPQNTKSIFPMFVSHQSFKYFVENSELKELFLLENSLLSKSMHANINKSFFEPSSEPHTEHTGELSCEKCCAFYNRYIKLNDAQIQSLSMATISQSESELWHNSRKIRITGSSAHKVPVRDTTNSDNFLREHMYPSFTGNKFTRHGQEGEILAKQQLRSSGWHIEDTGTIVSFEEPWLSVSPDGIVTNANGSKCLLEIKYPILKNDQSLDSLFTIGKYDVVKSLQNGTLYVKHNSSRGYYLQMQLTLHVTHMQLCKLVIWTTNEYKVIDVQYDQQFCEAAISRLCCFYFNKLLPRVVDDFECGRFKISKKYVKFSN